MYNDSVTTIGRGNGAMLVLLYLSAAFDTIDHDNLFVEMCGNVLKLIKSYFSNHTQRVQINNILLDFANIICSVSMSAILKYQSLVIMIMLMTLNYISHLNVNNH